MPDPNATIANQQLGKSLENLLVSKNRRLQDDLTKLRVSWEDLNTEHVQQKEEIDSLQADVQKQRGLVERLESDLAMMNNGKAPTSREPTGSSAAGLAGLDIGGKPVSLSFRCTYSSNLF